MRLIRTTYEIVTPESAEAGDVAETGWNNKSGEPIVPDKYDIEEHGSELAAVAALTARKIGLVTPSSSDWTPRTWYTDADPDIDYETGAETRKSYHLDGYSAEESRAVFDAVTRVRK